MTADNEEVVWIFVGGKNPNPSAAFSSRESAEEWIAQTKLSGMLTAYPLECSGLRLGDSQGNL